MSEEDRDIDVESDDVPDVGVEATASTSNSMDFEEDGLDKRAHHNALERRRRDHIKDSFHGLRDTIPSLHGEKVSRAHILNKATEYIRQLQKGGAVREGEIHDLKKKNEILEEQVQAMEQAKTLGNVENAEEILQMVVERVQARQRQHLQQQQQTKVANNQHSRRVDKSSEGNRDSNQLPDHTPLTSRSPTIAGSTDNRAAKEGANPLLPNSINLLASNLKSAQSLLTALQKNLPANANLPANVKSLAARVLASPFRQQGNSTAHPQTVPRGIVTATTMPKGTPLPATLASALQQQQQPRSQGTPHTGMATGNTSPAPATQLMPTIPTTPIVPTSTSKVDSVAVPMSVQSVSKGSPTVIPRATTVSMPHLSPSLLSQASSLSSQLLAANSLLQQGSAGRPGSGIAASPQLTPELIAQVSSFLNLPAAGASKPSSAEGLKVTAPIPSDTSTVMTTATTATSGDGLEVVGTHTSATVSTVATISTAAGAGGQCSMEGSQDGNAISSATDKPSPLKRGPPETTSETAAKKARVEL